MSGIVAANPVSEADYTAIEQAVMETERGRWFLAEYAKRNRHADTQVLLSALSRIEKSIAIQQEPTEIEKFRVDVLEMSRAIAKTHQEIAAIRPDDSRLGRLMEASGELDSIVAATETATSDILAAAESIQEAAWTLREADADAALCDMLDARATEIYTACSFQDLTAQRIRKVTEALGFLEKRINAMVDIWQFADDAAAPESAPVDVNAGLARDPSMSQADVDFVLVEDPTAECDNELDMAHPVSQPDPGAFAATQPLDDLEVVGADMLGHAEVDDEPTPVIGASEDADEILFSAPPPVEPAPQPAPERLQLIHTASPAEIAARKARNGAELTAEEAARALDALKGMSIEERTRLFS